MPMEEERSSPVESYIPLMILFMYVARLSDVCGQEFLGQGDPWRTGRSSAEPPRPSDGSEEGHSSGSGAAGQDHGHESALTAVCQVGLTVHSVLVLSCHE